MKIGVVMNSSWKNVTPEKGVRGKEKRHGTESLYICREQFRRSDFGH
jgi:hypothetical protein